MKHLLLIAAILTLVCNRGVADPKTPIPPKKIHADAHIPKESKFLKELLKDLRKGEGLPASSSGVSRGDYNGDGFADLAIGIPLEDTPAGVSASGAVVVIYGSRNGLTSSDPAVPAPQFWSQNTDGISGASESGDRFGTSLAAGEFNGDAYSDLAIGVPGEDITADGTASVSAGRVVIIYGSPAGLAASGPNVVRAPQSFDLVTANPEPRLDISIDYVVAAGANLGQSLAWGDFDGDGFGDLAMGAPKMDIKFSVFLTLFPTEESGAVWVLFGSKTGLHLDRQDLFHASDFVFPLEGRVDTTGWHYGASLTSGDYDGNGADDLAIGAPDEDIFLGPSGRFADRAGAVEVIPGSKKDFTGPGGLFGNSALLCQHTALTNYSSAAFQTDPQPNEHFGFALASGDFDNDDACDLAIGVPGQSGLEVRTLLGTYMIGNRDAGAVHVVYGVSVNTYKYRPSATFANTIGEDVQYLDQNAIFGSGNETGDRFGTALAAGHFGIHGTMGLAIGVPGEDLAGGADAGQVDVVYCRTAFTRLSGSEATPKRLGDVSAQAGAQFGSTLSAWDFGRNIYPPGFRADVADLAVGVPFKDVSGKVDAGAVHIFYGNDNTGLSFTGEQEWTQDSPGIPGACETSDLFGAAGY